METEYIICEDCTYPYEADKERCPNPACWPGLANWLAALREWKAGRDARIAEQTRNRSVWYNHRALEENYERDNPKPQTKDYAR